MGNTGYSPVINPIISQDRIKGNGLQKLLTCSLQLFEGGDGIDHSQQNDDRTARRKLTRYMTNGIVALASSERPIVTNLYDISPGGVSFLSRDENDLTVGEFEMDIVIFDSRTKFEYFIQQVKGRVRSKELVTEPKSNKPIWRFGVEFSDLDSLKQGLLHAFCDMERTIEVCSPSRPLVKIDPNHGRQEGRLDFIYPRV